MKASARSGRALALLAALAGACAPPAAAALTMATTTSVGNSGLLDVLLPAYQRASGTTVRAHLVGSGRALAMLAGGGADVVISHAPEAEASALAAHPDWRYRKIMYNDFVIVGPPADPAGVRGAASPVEAMRRIAGSEHRFISRGDSSGTHEREQRLWAQAGVLPEGNRLVAAGAGMGSTLRVASEAIAYTLTDRATYAQHAGSLHLDILFEGAPELMNTYAVVARPGGPLGAEAQAFADWLSVGDGRRIIGDYRVGASPAFRPWPAGSPARTPGDLPR